MSDEARANKRGTPPTDEGEQHESWLREAAHAPQAMRLPKQGQVIGGKYRIESLLGRGGMGVVFRARHVVSERQVAIKWMLRPTSDEQAHRRFEREARAAGRIEHPNVVSLFDIGDEGECSYLVMELLRGESLRARLARGRLQPTEAVDTLMPALRGVAAAHRAGVVHRDLKPDNIFLCESPEGGPGVAKVLDFGISSIASLEAADSTLTQEGTLLGSLAYMSPEQLRSPHEVDARTDVYAFGVILYELLSGTLPFAGASHSALIVAIATTEPRRLSQLNGDVPSGLETVVLQAFARDRAERYQDIAGLVEALSPFASAASLGARMSSGVPLVPSGIASGAPALRPASPDAPTVTLGGTPVTPVTFGDRAARGSALPRVVLAATAALLILAGLWALFERERAAEAPVVDRASTANGPSEAASAVATPTPPVIAAPAVPPPVGVGASTAAAPPTTAAAPAPAAPAPAARPRASRTKGSAASRITSATSKPADDKALFSGRK